MAAKTKDLASLFGKDLTGFKIIETVEVYRLIQPGAYGTGGVRKYSFGYFINSKLAGLLAATNKKKGYQTRNALVLTNGTDTYDLEARINIQFADEKVTAHDLRQDALRVLSSEQRQILEMKH